MVKRIGILSGGGDAPGLNQAIKYATKKALALGYEVYGIVDGDTLKIRYWGKEESIRLIGIDTPESGVNKKAKRDAKRSGQDIKTITSMGKRATEYVESLVKPGGT
jgi:endonuclease YncB( thermonuclease family)